MNKSTLVNSVAAKTGVTKTDTRLMVSAVFDAIIEELAKGKEVAYPGFGTLRVSTVRGHETVNPLTGEREMRAEHRKVSFRAAAEFKKRMNG